MKTLTKAAILAQRESDVRLAHADGYVAGKLAAEQNLSFEMKQAKLAQQQAAAKLMEEAGRIMSRAGYMIGKINGDNSR